MLANPQATETLINDFAAALGCKPKFVQTRLVVLGHGKTCGRCGGGGSYSYCQTYGTTCFGCSGSGRVARGLSTELLATVQAQVAGGELAPYLAKLKAAADRKAKLRGCNAKIIMAAWESNPSVKAGDGVHWSKCSKRHHDLNAFCCPLYQEANKLTEMVEKGVWTNDVRGYVTVSEDLQEMAVARLTEILGMVRDAEALAPERQK